MSYQRPPPRGPVRDKKKYFSSMVNKSFEISTGTSLALQEIARKTGYPFSKLVAVAIDKELDRPDAFQYPIDLPTSDFEEYAYSEEAKLIFNFLNKFEGGTGVDTLILCRRDVGIPNRGLFMFGYRELLEAKMIEEYQVSANDAHYGKVKNYYRVRIIAEYKKSIVNHKHAPASEITDDK